MTDGALIPVSPAKVLPVDPLPVAGEFASLKCLTKFFEVCQGFQKLV